MLGGNVITTSRSTAFQTKLKWLLLFIPVLSLFCRYGDAPPCDEQIDQLSHEKLILSNPVIARLNSDLKLAAISAGSCYYKGVVSSTLSYQLPSDWSLYGITYGIMVTLHYFEDGHFEIIMPGASKTQPLHHEQIMADLKARILALETNPSPRIKEVISRIEPTHGSLSTGYFSKQTPYGMWLIQYSLVPEQESWEYSLPNSMEWSEFPEIDQAQEFVEKSLLLGNPSSCHITRSGFRSTIHGKMYGMGNRSWFMSVPLECKESLKDVTVKVNPDGSIEDLGITWQTPK